MPNSDIEILLIEDNPHEAELTIRSLKKQQLAGKLMHISDGAEAIDFLLSTDPSSEGLKPVNLKLILLDLKLPKVDGLEILRKIKEDPRTKMIPVVVLTSSKEEKDIIESYKLGASSYIVKPVNFESFAKTISELGLYWMTLNQHPPL